MTRDESYWTARNALVDAVHAAEKDSPSCVADPAGFAAWLESTAGAAYKAARRALETFDAEHGGTPIL